MLELNDSNASKLPRIAQEDRIVFIFIFQKFLKRQYIYLRDDKFSSIQFTYFLPY